MASSFLPQLQSTELKWRQRAAMAQKVGVPPASINALAQYDINRVKMGSQPLTNQEVEDALNAQLYKTPVVQQHPRTGPLNILGNVPSDVYGIVSGFIPGAINFVHHLPSELGQLGKDVSHPSLASISHDPILSLIPGLYDVGQMATPTGRAWLQEHPISSLLDILPLGSSAGKAAMAGREVEAGSALEALQRGNPVKAGLRAGTDSLSSLASRILHSNIDLRAAFDRRLSHLGLDATTREVVARPFSQLTRQGRAIALGIYDNKIAPLFKGLSEEEQHQLWKDATVGGGIASNPAHQHIIDAVRDYNQVLAQAAEGRKALYSFVMPGGHHAVYSYDQKISVIHRRLRKTKASLENHALKILTETRPSEIKRRNTLIAKRREQVTQLEKVFHEELAKTPDASFHPAIIDAIRSGVKDQVAKGNLAANVQITSDIFDRIDRTPSEQYLKSLLPAGVYEQIRDDSMRMWLDMEAKGFNPVWVKHVSTEQTERALFPKPVPDHKMTPSQFKSRVLNFSPGIESISAGLTATETELLQEIMTENYLNHLMDSKIIRPLSEIYPQYEDFVTTAKQTKLRRPTQPAAAAAEVEMNKEWVKFDPTHYGMSKKAFAHRPQDMVIPRGTYNAMELMRTGYRFGGPEGLFKVGGIYDRSLHVFRVSVLTGPRHFVHIALGGMMFQFLRHPMSLKDLHVRFMLPKIHDVAEWEKWKKSLPQELFGGINDFTADQIWNFKVGQAHANILSSFWHKAGDIQKKYVQFEERIGAVQRAAVYLDQVGRGVTHEQALQEAYKTFIDLDGMAPIERAVMKQIVPFYPFMRHLFRYLFSLPVDHPYRVAILDRWSQQEQQEWDTGLPQMYQSYLFLGSPDKNGNVVGIDTKNINPFRSFYNDFTLAGFVSSMNPIATSVGTAMGINILSASPQLTTAWDYNPVTGGKTGIRPENVAVSALESFIPSTQAIDAFAGLSNRFRYLRQSNPAAFQRELFNYLNLPFATSTVNIPLTQEKAEINRYQAAQTALSNAMRTGNWNQVSEYNLVPYNQQLVPTASMAEQMSVLQRLLSQYGILDPNAVLRKPSYTLPFHLG